MIKTAICFFVLSTIALATPVSRCTTNPGLDTERVPICLGTPGWGDKLVLPSSSFEARISFEDWWGQPLPQCVGIGSGDCDAQDIFALITGDFQIGKITVTASGGPLVAAYTNEIQVAGISVGIGETKSLIIPWVPGQELIVQDHVTTTSGDHYLWSTGGSDRNADGYIHALVRTEFLPPVTDVPEPATCFLVVSGLFLVFYFSRK